MTRALSALLLGLGLLLTGACNSDQTGDSVTENQKDERPATEEEDKLESPSS